jgi:hypothetical protein
MIKFFRKIRQNMLSEGKIVKYFKYAIGEIVLVMIGILLALQVNNWNENRKMDNRRQAYYSQLLEDLNSDIISAQNTIKDFSKYLKDYNEYLDLYINDMLTPIQAYEQISKLPLISQPFNFSTSTIESLQSSGDIGLIPPSIRNKLIDLRRFQNLTIERFEDTDNGKSDITQNVSLYIGSTTLPKRLINQAVLAEFLNLNEKMKEMILLYEGIHRWKSISQQEAVDRLVNMLKEIDTIITLIDKELNK